jgi:hypothetical protein
MIQHAQQLPRVIRMIVAEQNAYAGFLMMTLKLDLHLHLPEKGYSLIFPSGFRRISGEYVPVSDEIR